jgi:predicted phage terminase large subunit-like protein
MSATDIKVYFSAVRADFKVFLQQAFATLHPGTPFLNNWHLDAIIHCLEQGLHGKMPRLAINLPPRHMKSLIVATAWPAFVMGRDPTAKFICVSYSDDLARHHAREFRRLVESPWYRATFPELKLTKSTEGEVVTDQGGYRYTTSVGGTLTGRGADFIIIDDPIKPDDARSDKARESVNEWFRSTLVSRLDDKEFSVMILVMQRVHVNDLTGYLEAGGGVHRLSLSAIARREETIALRGGQWHQRLVGDVLHPERESLVALERIRRELGPLNFSAQYQQAPETPDGSLFKLKWFKRIDKLPKIGPYATLYCSIDSAVSTAQTADYSAISLILVDGRNFYVMSAERGRWDYEQLKAKALAYCARYKAVSFVIEAASSGISLIQYLRSKQITCFWYTPKLDKMARACNALPIVAAGRVHLLETPGKCDWVPIYLNEFVTFPFGRFDDQVDSLVQLLPWADARHNPDRSFYGDEQ